jgi:hypothetical protein
MNAIPVARSFTYENRTKNALSNPKVRTTNQTSSIFVVRFPAAAFLAAQKAGFGGFGVRLMF